MPRKLRAAAQAAAKSISELILTHILARIANIRFFPYYALNFTLPLDAFATNQL